MEKRPGNFKTMRLIKEANHINGFFFFEPGAMRFFDSQIHTIEPIHGCLFITSEQFNYDSPRLYTIRKANQDGSIESVSEFQEFETIEEANAAAEKLWKLGQVGSAMTEMWLTHPANVAWSSEDPFESEES